jgi:hypothetical protein
MYCDNPILPKIVLLKSEVATTMVDTQSAIQVASAGGSSTSLIEEASNDEGAKKGQEHKHL